VACGALPPAGFVTSADGGDPTGDGPADRAKVAILPSEYLGELPKVLLLEPPTEGDAHTLQRTTLVRHFRLTERKVRRRVCPRLCGVVWCGVVVCGVVWCGVVWCGVVVCGVVWCGVVWCGVVWCGVVWCGVVWCGVVCTVVAVAIVLVAPFPAVCCQSRSLCGTSAFTLSLCACHCRWCIC
jgi:hypothetical protein